MSADRTTEADVRYVAAGAAGRPPVGAYAGISLAGHLLVISIIGVLLKQLRLIGESLGPFELLGALSATYFIVTNRARPTAADAYFMRFQFFMVGAFISGAAVSALFLPEHFSPRELVATIYVALIVFGWVNFRDGTLEARIGLLRDYLAGYCGLILIMAILGYPFLKFVWYFDVYFGRLMGLSDNPNQLAGLANAGVVLSAAGMMLAGRVTRRDVAATAAVLMAGTMSLSVTFMLSVALAGVVATFVYGWIVTEAGSVGRRLFNIALSLSALLCFLALLILGDRVAAGIIHLWSGETAKGATRLAYWMEALSESLWSPLVGLGPGGHVRVDYAAVLQEAHNIFVELFLSGGLVALAAYLFMLLTIATISMRNRLAVGIFCLVALVVMGSFHTVLRHAHHWIAFHALISVVLAMATQRASATPSQDPQGAF